MSELGTGIRPRRAATGAQDVVKLLRPAFDQGLYNMRWLLRSKIHKAHVTAADVAYVGSITIDEDLVERAGFWPNERVLGCQQYVGSSAGDLRYYRGQGLRRGADERRCGPFDQTGGRNHRYGIPSWPNGPLNRR